MNLLLKYMVFTALFSLGLGVSQSNNSWLPIVNEYAPVKYDSCVSQTAKNNDYIMGGCKAAISTELCSRSAAAGTQWHIIKMQNNELCKNKGGTVKPAVSDSEPRSTNCALKASDYHKDIYLVSCRYLLLKN